MHINEPEGAYTTIVPELGVGEGNNKETQTPAPESEERMHGIGRETQTHDQRPSEPAEGEEVTTQPQPPEPAGTTPTVPLRPKIANFHLPWSATDGQQENQNVRLSDSLPGTMEHHGKQVVSAKSATLPNRSSRSSQIQDDEVVNEQPEQTTLTKRESQVSGPRDEEPEDMNRFNEPEQAIPTKCSSQVKEGDQIQEEIDVGRSNEQLEQATKQDSQVRDDEVPEDMERFNVQPKQATWDNQMPAAEDTERYETPEQFTVNNEGSQVRDERVDRVQNDIKRFSKELELPTLTPLDETPSTAPVQSPTVTSTDQETAPSRSSIVQGETFESLERVRIRHDSVQESKKDIPKETEV